jgi:hypothetical protein
MRWLLLAVLPLLILAACAHPNVTLDLPARAAVPAGQVEVIQSRTMPKGYQVMGRAYAWSPLPIDKRKGFIRAVADLQKRAAGVGTVALWVPPEDDIEFPATQSYWMDRQTQLITRSNGDSDYVQPHELMGILLVPAP